MNLIYRLTLTILFLSIAILWAWVNYLFYSKDYEEFINWVISALNKKDNWKPFLEARLSVKSFEVVRILLLVFDAGLLLLLSVFLRYRKMIESGCLKGCTYFYHSLQNHKRWFFRLPAFDRYFFFVITAYAFIKAIYYDIQLPIQYDEAWTFNYYIDNGLWQSFLLPSNNHKFFTLIAWWFNLLPFDTQLLIRFPNALAGVSLLGLFFVFLRKHFKKGEALLGFAWFATCMPVAGYMSSARSYIYVLLFSLLLLALYYGSQANRPKKVTVFLIALTIVFGYFSNATFLFGHFILSVFFFSRYIITRQRVMTKMLLQGNLLASPFVAIAYVPDMLAGHFSGLLSVAYKVNEHQNYFMQCLELNGRFQIGFGNYYFLFTIVLIAGIALCFMKRYRSQTLLYYSVLSILWLPFYASMVHDDTSRSRTIYITISFTLLLIFLMRTFFDRYLRNKRFVLWMAALIVGINFFNLRVSGWFTWSVDMDNSVKNVSEWLMENRAKNCYIMSFYYKPGVEYYHRIHDKRIDLYMKESNSIDFVDNLFVVNQPEYILTEKGKDDLVRGQNYTLVYSDEFVSLYRKNTG